MPRLGLTLAAGSLGLLIGFAVPVVGTLASLGLVPLFRRRARRPPAGRIPRSHRLGRLLRHRGGDVRSEPGIPRGVVITARAGCGRASIEGVNAAAAAGAFDYRRGMIDDPEGPVADFAELRHLLPGDPLVLGELGGSDRSQVHRVRAGGETVIVKRFNDGGEGFAREAAALSVMPIEAPAPRLLGESTEPPAVILSDAGTGRNVADDLLDADPEVARAGLLSWAEAIARLHACTANSGDAFRKALAARTHQPVSTLVTAIETAVSTLDEHCAELGVRVPAGAWDELRGLYARLEGGPAVLSPGDTCPDNNVATPSGLVLIDFESAQWHHPAWDVAYLNVPWPTCWCSWRLPLDVREEALRRYQQTSTLPWAASFDFRADIAVAAAVWAIVTTSWFLSTALGDDPPLADPRKLMPTRRSQILHRLRLAAPTDDLQGGPGAAAPTALRGGSALGTFAAGLRETLVERWGDLPLPYAPAFRTSAP